MRGGANQYAYDLVILACAISAGIHGALIPAHFQEGAGAGAGFVAATVLLGAAAVLVTLRPATMLHFATVALAGLLASYALAISVGLPLLHPAPEPVDLLAIATKGVEAMGLLAASTLLRRRNVAVAFPRPKGI
jgi:hypothetical protein